MAPRGQRKQPEAVYDAHAVKAELTECLKSAYGSSNEKALDSAADNITKLFKAISNDEQKKEVFFQEMWLRLEFLVCSRQEQSNRLRSMRALALSGVKLNVEEEMPTLTDGIIEFCQKYARSQSLTVRSYVCTLMGFLYKSSTEYNLKDGERCGLTTAQYRQLFTLLSHRVKDQKVGVRVEALRALSHIQDDAVPADHTEAMDVNAKEYIVRALSDTSPECRIEAVRLLTADADVSGQIVAVALHDLDTNVKDTAYTKIISDRGLNAMTNADRMELLEAAVKNQQDGNSAQAQSLITSWLRFTAQKSSETDEKPDTLFASTLGILDLLEVENDEDLCERALYIAFEQLAKKKKGILEFIRGLSSEVNSVCLHKLNFKRLLNESLTIKQRAHLFFHWRVLIQFCSDRLNGNDRQWGECLYKLAPTLHTYTEFAREFVAQFAAPKNVPQNTTVRRQLMETYRQLCFLQLINVFQFLERDSVGMASWKEFLYTVLSRRIFEVSAEVIQEIAASIMFHHYPLPEDQEKALYDFSDQIAVIAQRCINPGETQMEQSQLTVLNNTETTFHSQLSHVKLDDNARMRCLTIIYAMLKTGRFRNLTTVLEGLYDSVVPQCYASENVEERKMAIECLGIVSIISPRFASTHTSYIRFVMENALPADKIVGLNILCDFVLSHGYNKVNELICTATRATEEEPENAVAPKPLNTLVMELTRDEKEVDLAFTAAECLCKWLLIEKVSNWKKVLFHLLELTFDGTADANKRLSELISCFWPLFSSVSRRNQLMLADVYTDILDELKQRDMSTPQAKINEKKLADFICTLTSYDVLAENATDRNKGSTHTQLARNILNALMQNADDLNVGIYCLTLSKLEVNTEMKENECDELLEMSTQTSEQLHEAKNKKLAQQYWKKLNTFKSRLWKLSDAQDNMDATNVPLDDIRGNLDELSVTTTVRQNKRAMKTPRMPAAKRQFLVEAITDKLKTARERRSTGSPLIASRTRPVYDRAAKGNHRFIDMVRRLEFSGSSDSGEEEMNAE